MVDEKAANQDDVHAVIGYEVALLLEAERPVHLHEIAALLRHEAEKASNEVFKHNCLNALRLIAEKMN